MSDKTVTQLTELTTVSASDIAYIIEDPAGTPVSKKATSQNLVKGGASQGAISEIVDANLTAERALVSSSEGKIEVSSVTSTELGHLSGVTSGIQGQFDSKINYRGSQESAPTPWGTDIYHNTEDNKVYIYITALTEWVEIGQHTE